MNKRITIVIFLLSLTLAPSISAGNNFLKEIAENEHFQRVQPYIPYCVVAVLGAKFGGWVANRSDSDLEQRVRNLERNTRRLEAETNKTIPNQETNDLIGSTLNLLLERITKVEKSTLNLNQRLSELAIWREEATLNIASLAQFMQEKKASEEATQV